MSTRRSRQSEHEAPASAGAPRRAKPGWGTDARTSVSRRFPKPLACTLASLSLLALCFRGTCTPGDNLFPPAGDSGDTRTLKAIAGLEFFSQKGCAACHCNDAVGGCNLDAPNLGGAGFDKIDLALRADQGRRPHPMKMSLSDAEIDNLATFFGTLQDSTPLDGNSQVTLGYNLYVKGGCITCHLASAQGVNQGGIGLPIAGTSPDNIYAALSGAIPCHPRQREIPADPPADCRFGIATNETVQSLTDTPPPDIDAERVLLSYFLSFIAPPPSAGVIEPCKGLPGDICTIAGNGISGFTGDGVPSTEALLYSPLELALTDWNADGVLDLIIVDWNNHRIRVVYLDAEIDGVPNRIDSIAGTGKVTGDDALNHPTDVAFDADGALVMANWHNQNIYRYARGLLDGGDRDQLAGLCDLACHDDSGGPTRVDETFLSLPTSVAIHPDGRIFIAEGGCSRIRVLHPGQTRTREQPAACITPINLMGDGMIETLAGRAGQNGYAGDGGPASQAIFNVDNAPISPNFGIAFSPEDPPQRLYVADSRNNCIRYIDLSVDPPTIHLFAGIPMQPGFQDGPADQAKFNYPTYPYVHTDGVVYVADTRNHAIRRIDSGTREVTTIAGAGQRGFNGDNLPAKEAQLNNPYGVVVHPDGRIFIADTDNNRVRVVLP